ncbi:DNA-directed RNA polymerase subunit beta [Quillaja saponaria]|uniref:DNA-directed RNA polymerase subunit beta n=1 Tax=Quillaja saponaria TaxID=32244 RepID=A0AAD7KSU9_QUISA|nr:DNA-directed RNA polymerase subunit beta [Quillaja saponaria]KAJ7945385.1 DNA-directed RNA polymerase subunit beta [Quillaja saponaria]
MVNGDSFTDGSHKTRPALSDMTNRTGKRAFSLISADSGLKSGRGYLKKFDANDGDSQFTKQVRLGVENLVKEKCKAKFGVDCDDMVLSLQKGQKFSDSLPVYSGVGTSLKNVSSDSSNLPNEIMERGHLVDSSVRGSEDTATEIGNAAKDSCLSSVLVPTCSGSYKENCSGLGEKSQSDENILTSGVTEGRSLIKGLVTHAQGNDDMDRGKLTSSKFGAIEWSRLPVSNSSKFPGLERCVGLKDDGSENPFAGADDLKNCSCTFCLKAAYIWSDLHYQDIKGRISALKRSRKEASVLIQKFSEGKETATHDQGNFNESLKLESGLRDQWRSIFLHMEEIFVHESSQLESSFDTLKSLRENCKMDLEMINQGPSDNH